MTDFNGFRLDYTNCNHIQKPSRAVVEEAVEDLIYRTFPNTEQVLPKYYGLIKRHYGYNAIQMTYNYQQQCWIAEHFFIEGHRRKNAASYILATP